MTDKNPASPSDANNTALRQSGPRRGRHLARPAIVLTLTVAVLAAGTAFAAHHWPRGPEADRDRLSFLVEHVVDRIDGTDEQQTAFEAIIDRHFAELSAVHKEAREMKMKLAEALLAERPDAVQIETLRKKVVALVDRASVTLSKALREASGVLTPVQKREILDQLADRFAR